jgi:hypothetical protein
VSEPDDDPAAALPGNASFHVRAFYNEVQELIDGIDDPAAQKALQDIWDWMTTHVPERFLRP